MINLFKSVPSGDELDALNEVLESGWWAMGAKVEEFEKKFAEYVGAKYAVATNSCTTALDIAVRVVPLPDEVSVSAFTFVSSADCVLRAGKKLRFVDIDEETFCTPKADIQVFYGGNHSGEGIIYDMAHCGGSYHHGVVSCWSFHAVKNLPTGDGGMLTTNNEDIYRRAKAMSWCGIDKSTYARSKGTYSWEYDIKELGMKANMSDLTAAIGLCQLAKLPENNAYRAKLASWYDQYLPEHIKRPSKTNKTWHLYAIRVKDRNKVYEHMAANGVTCGVHYKPLHHYPIFKDAFQGHYDGQSVQDWRLPVTEAVYSEILSLPMHLDLEEEDIKTVCNLLR